MGLWDLQQIELKLERDGKGELLPRTADIDILLFEGESRSTKSLTIPHHALFDRKFSVLGTKEVAGSWITPDGSSTFKEYCMRSEVEKQEIEILRVSTNLSTN